MANLVPDIDDGDLTDLLDDDPTTPLPSVSPGPTFGPYGNTVDDVTALVPQATLTPAGTTPGRRDMAVSVDQVGGWLVELAGWVTMRATRWPQIPDEDPVYARTQFLALARTVVANGAASYLMAARHPELATPNTTSYQTVLWQRFTDGLTMLEGWLNTHIPDTNADDIRDPAGQPAGSFPMPLFVDNFRF